MSEEEKVTAMQQDGQNDMEKVRKDLRYLTALYRTALSSEQSLMSWIRTSVSLLTLGFTITQIFNYLDKQHEGLHVSAGPRSLGLALIWVGIIALVLGMIEHVHRLRRMREQGLKRISQYLLPLGSAAVLLVIGIAALVIVMLNWSL
jgi:uncharacterized membrane protein YidH (DUF202 family)